MTLNPSFKGVVFTYMTQVLYVNSINYKNFTYRIANERFLTNQLVFYFQRNHFIADKFSEKIALFQQFGLVQKLTSNYVDMRFAKYQAPKKQKTALTLTNLSAVFGVWLVVLLVSILFFLLELCWHRSQKRMKLKKPTRTNRK